MKEIFQYIKGLFYDKNVALSKRDTITIFSMLFSISSFSSYSLFRNVLMSFLAKEKGIEHFGEHSIFNSFYNIALSIGIPWTFLLLILAMAYAHKLYKHTILKWVFGFLIFTFFRTIIYLPAFFFTIEDLYGSEFSTLNSSFLSLKIIIGIISLAGAIAFFYPMNDSVDASFSDKNCENGICRGKFSRYILYTILSTITFSLLIVGYEYLVNDANMFRDKLGLIIIAIALIMATIFYLVLMGKRLINAGKSVLYLLLLLLFSLIQSAANYVMFKVENPLFTSLSSSIVDVTIIASNLFLLWLMVAPTNNKNQSTIESIGSN